MTYLSVEELTPPGHSGRSFVDGFSVEERMTAADEASACADSYFANRFEVIPIPSPSLETKRRVRHVAIYLLLSGRGLNPENVGHQRIVQDYYDAIKWFEGVAKGLTNPSNNGAIPADEDDLSLVPSVTTSAPRGW